MTVKELLENALIETKKNGVPNLLLRDYNYFINKAIQQKINEIYNYYNADQQRTDDLRVLKDYVKIPILANSEQDEGDNAGKIYEVRLPDNYYHLISCEVQFKLEQDWHCYDKDTKWRNKAIRATGEINGDSLNNAYFRPSYRTPYYYVINNSYSSGFINNYIYLFEYDDDYTNETKPTIIPGGTAWGDKEWNEHNGDFASVPKSKMVGSTLDIIYKALSASEKAYVNIAYKARIQGLFEKTTVDGNEIPAAIEDKNLKAAMAKVETPEQAKEVLREMYNNVILQIRPGPCDVFKPINVFVDYIKTPKCVRLSQRQFDQDIDTSEVLEFPHYMCLEILDRLVMLLLENYSDDRLRTNPQINQTIAPPAEVQQAQQGRRR